MSILSSTGKRIRALMANQEIKGVELVAMMKDRGVQITPGQLSSIVTERRGASVSVLVGIADVLDVSLDYLTMRTGAS